MNDKITQQLRVIAWAAHHLEQFLSKNVGTTDDWPVSLTCSDEESSVQLVQMLEELREALVPFRLCIGEPTRKIAAWNEHQCASCGFAVVGDNHGKCSACGAAF